MPQNPKPAFPNPAATLPGEADILANVLADLSDHDAKLVYADWLEEHGDPRGPLLRAFITAYRAGGQLLSMKSAPESWRNVVGLTLMEKIRQTGFASKTDALLALVRPAITLAYTKAKEDLLPIGVSKFGGRPDMPANVEWSEDDETPLTFLAQFNLAELHASPVARELPATGVLSLFCLYDYGEDFTDTNWRLLCFPNAASLVRRNYHDDLHGEEVAQSFRLSFTESPTLPRVDSLWGTELKRVFRGIERADSDYDNLCDGMGGDALLGYPRTFEGDVLGKKSVRHLLTVGDNFTNGWWPDGNMMFVTITEADLKKGVFSRAKATLQTF